MEPKIIIMEASQKSSTRKEDRKNNQKREHQIFDRRLIDKA